MNLFCSFALAWWIGNVLSMGRACIFSKEVIHYFPFQKRLEDVSQIWLEKAENIFFLLQFCVSQVILGGVFVFIPFHRFRYFVHLFFFRCATITTILYLFCFCYFTRPHTGSIQRIVWHFLACENAGSNCAMCLLQSFL